MPGAINYRVQRATTSGGPYANAVPLVSGTSFLDTNIGAGKRFYYVVVTNGSNFVASNSSAETSAIATSSGLDAVWSGGDIGSTGAAGYEAFYNGVYTLNGAGADIWLGKDAFHFTWQSWSGDGVLTARIITEANTDPWAKAGVMFRETLTNSSKYAFTLLTPGNGTAFQLRTTAGSLNTNTTGSAAPAWVQLVRSGDSFTSYGSPDGMVWTPIGTGTSNPMASNLYAGLAVCSHSGGTLNTTTMDNVSFLTAPTGMAVTYLSESQLALNWTDKSTGETGYSVERSPAGANTWILVSGTMVPGSTSWTDGKLSASTSYDYRVKPTGLGASSPYAFITVATPAGIGDGIPGWWRYQYFGNGLTVTAASASNADPDQDGRSNFLEYATGSDPTKADAGAAAQVGLSPDQTKLTLTFNRISDPGLIYQVFATSDLTTNPSPELIWSSTGAANVAGPVTVTDTTTVSSQPRRFLYLQVSH